MEWIKEEPTTAQLVILKKSGAAIRIDVIESADTIYMELSDLAEDQYTGRHFRRSDFINLTKTDKTKVVINKRYICYVADRDHGGNTV